MRRQPARHQRGGVFDIGEVGQAERDDGQAVERSRDALGLTWRPWREIPGAPDTERHFRAKAVRFGDSQTVGVCG